MTKKRLWVIAGVLGASSIAALPAISQAGNYPPGQRPTFTYNHGTVSVTNAGLDCTFRVVSGRFKKNVHVDGNGAASVTVDFGTKTGTRVILAKTISCKGKATKTFKDVPTKTYTLRTDKSTGGDTSAKAGDKITIKALGWDPNSKVAISIRDDTSAEVKHTSRTPNSSGNVFWKVTTPRKPGTYVVVATQDGKSQSFKLTINPKKHH